jgi:GNAT superfamily N-acetyltransferase
MVFREAQFADIGKMHGIRVAVKENRLSDPNRISSLDYEKNLKERGKVWVCEIEAQVIRFAIVDLFESKIWALFVDPIFEGKSVGRKLQQLMLNWYFKQTENTIWLGTSPGTRAEQFYRKTGWKATGTHSNGEILFEMSIKD